MEHIQLPEEEENSHFCRNQALGNSAFVKLQLRCFLEGCPSAVELCPRAAVGARLACGALKHPPRTHQDLGAAGTRSNDFQVCVSPGREPVSLSHRG